MKIRNIDILLKINAVRELGKKRLPYVFSRAINKNLDTFIKESELIEQERIRICTECAKKDGEGQPLINDNEYVIEDMESFRQKLDELHNAEVEIEISRVPEKVIERCDEEGFDALTVEEAGVIEFMVE